jgi:hypothetical protein
MRGRHKAAQIAEDDLEPAGVVAAYHGLYHFIVIHRLLGDQPILLLKRARERDQQVPFPVRGLQDVDRPGCAFLDFRQHLLIEPAQVAGWYDRFSFQTQVDDDFLGTDGDDGTFADVAALGHVVPALIEQGLHRVHLGGWLGRR